MEVIYNMGFFGILILIGIIGLIFGGMRGGYWHRRRYGHFRPFGFWRHRPPEPRGTRDMGGPIGPRNMGGPRGPMW